MATKLVAFRASDAEREKIKRLVHETGMKTASDVLRALVRSAELRRVTKNEPAATLPIQTH